MANRTYNASRIGRETELKAWLWLVRHDYNVFDNIFPNGPIDFVAVSCTDGSVLKIDVKKASPKKGGGYHFLKLTDKQVKLGVQLLIYLPDVDDFQLIAPELAAAPVSNGRRRLMSVEDNRLSIQKTSGVHNSRNPRNGRAHWPY